MNWKSHTQLLVRRNLGFLALILILFSCQSDPESHTVQLKGDLFFPYFHSASFYGLPEEARTEYQNLVDSMGYDQLLEVEPERTQWMINLEKHNLVYSPYVHLNVGDEETIVVFLDSAIYEGFKSYDYATLVKDSNRIEVELEAELVWVNMYLARSVPKRTIVKGETFAWDKKMRINNYE